VILLAQISDPHIKLDDDTSQPALAAAVARVLTHKPRPAAVLVTGDIADSNDPAEHARAGELLAPLPMPVYRLAGNHDRGVKPYTADAGGLRIVACDTTRDGRDDGALDVEWLAAQLRDEVPTVVAMHHPPIEIGIPWLDEIGLANRGELEAVLRAAPHVQRVVAGHVHRTVTGTLGGCPVVTCTSTNIQAALEFGARDVALANEPPSILVHAWLGAQFVTHVHPVGSDPG
jgi:3',5'-cyclic AMP phosphodiesterase CpdA